jgi:hypothetical protein
MKSWNAFSQVLKPFVMSNLNKFRSKKWLNSHKLHGVTMCAITVFNMIFVWLPHLCPPHIQLPLRSFIRAVNYQTQIERQRPGRFSNATQRAPIGRWVKIKKQTLNISEGGEVIHYTLDGVSIHPVVTKLQASFLTPLPARKETTQGFHHETIGDWNSYRI